MRLRNVQRQARFTLLVSIRVNLIRPLPFVAIIGIGEFGVIKASPVSLIVMIMATTITLAGAIENALVATERRIVVAVDIGHLAHPADATG